MASFSFGAGNAAKLARLPLYAAGRIVTLFVPRTGRWVFGCGAGIGDGPLELWHLACERGHDAVWLTRDAEEERRAAGRGIPTVPRDSLRGFWRTARAGVIVVSHGFGDVNPYAVSGGFVVQLWHGIPLKRIGLDSPETVRSAFLPDSGLVRRLIGWMYRAASRRIRVLPAASHLVRGRLETAFGLPEERIVVTGEPRVDALSRGTAQERRRRAERILSDVLGQHPPGARFVLYAPTWRDGDPDPPGPGPSEWRRIIEVLERHDAVLLVRSHRLGAGEYVPPQPNPRVRGLGAEVLTDVTPALPGLSALITDYSSLAYDAGLVPLPVLYLAPDAAEYGARRGFYGSYSEVAGGDVASGWSEVAEQLDELFGSRYAYRERVGRSRALSDRVHAFRDGNNTRRVYQAVAARIAGASARPWRARGGNGKTGRCAASRSTPDDGRADGEGPLR